MFGISYINGKRMSSFSCIGEIFKNINTHEVNFASRPFCVRTKRSRKEDILMRYLFYVHCTLIAIELIVYIVLKISR